MISPRWKSKGRDEQPATGDECERRGGFLRRIVSALRGPRAFTPYHGSPVHQGGEEVVQTPKGSPQRPRLSSRGTGFTPTAS